MTKKQRAARGFRAYQVAQYITRGMTDTEIAKVLGIPRQNVQAIRAKLAAVAK